MSSIIDNTIFQSLVIFTDRQPPLKDHTLVQQIFHKLKVNQKYHITTNNDKIYQTKSTFEMPDKTFLVNLHLKRSTFNSKFTAIKIDQLTNQKIHSKHIDLLIMKEFFKYQKQFPSGSYVYINNGRIYLVMTNFLPNNQALKRSRIIDIYNEFLIKNLLNFQIFLKKYIQNKGNKTQREKKIVSQLNKQLQLARIVNTTHTTSNISIDKSHFRSANTSFEKRTDELMSIREMIEQQVCFQKTAQKLYDIVQEETYATWIKQNYIKYYMQNQKKIHNILALPVSAERKLEDFVYNMVKLEVKERIGGNVPINAGASSYIFAIQANITYISSTDMTVLPQSILKDEKILAVKKLKNQDPKKFDKIQHQKAVILKMRGSICPFLPKYFGSQSQNQLQKCLIMQLIQGENLDDYVTSRVQTMTLWTKISLLLNIIHGMRHLINYQITHLDLKPLNIKVVKNMITKIFDFGQAYHPEICSKEYIAASTFPYAAPEVFTRFCLADRKKNYDWQYSQKQDSYAFGVIMYEIIFGDCIYSLSTNKLKEFCLKKQTIRKIFLAPQRGQDYGEDKILSSILYIVLRCLDLDPAKRPCFEWIGISLKLMLNSYINIS